MLIPFLGRLTNVFREISTKMILLWTRNKPTVNQHRDVLPQILTASSLIHEQHKRTPVWHHFGAPKHNRIRTVSGVCADKWPYDQVLCRRQRQ